MAGTRPTRSSPRSSPRTSSAKSTPRAKAGRSTPLKTSTSGTSASTPRKSRSTPTGKTSPYFSKAGDKSKSNGKKAAKGKGTVIRAKVEVDSATGLTESEEENSSSDDADTEDEFNPDSSEDDQEQVEEEEEEESEVDSEDIDEEDDWDRKRKSATKKRQSTGGAGSGSGSAKKVKVKASATAAGTGNKGKQVLVEGYDDEDDDLEDIELEEGQEIAGRIYPAPKTGHVPPGRISQNTLNFLKNLQIPERNDRDWFRSHEPAFRLAEKEWKDFVARVQLKMHEADDQVPLLPPKDVVKRIGSAAHKQHRIYRDVRFSSDKTPYKKSFSLSTSRGGRKGIWAAYHLSISPNERSILACGIWQPGKNELAQIRHHILSQPRRLRDVIEAKDFVKLFGEAKPHPKGLRQNVFGNEDALKVAPKLEGVDKTHKDIDLLKLRSIAVVHKFSDEDVVSENFQEKVRDVMRVMVPFVHMLNDFVTLPAGMQDDGDGDGEDVQGDGGDDDDDEEGDDAE